MIAIFRDRQPRHVLHDKVRLSLRRRSGVEHLGYGLFLAENAAGKIDMVTISGDTAAITVLKEGLARPTAIEPTGDTLWYGERAGDRATSIPLPK